MAEGEVKDLDAAIGKAVETATKAPDEGQAGGATEKPQVDSGASNGDTGQVKSEGAQVPDKSPAKKESSVWNGDVNSLPPELQEHAKAVQRYVTQRSTEAAEAKKKLEELEKNQIPDNDLRAFRQWQEAEKQRIAKTSEPSITQQEWEDALLDTTGQKMNGLMRRQARFEAEQIRNQYLAEVQKQQAQQAQMAAFEKQVMEFAELNPDFEKFAKMGIMLPIAQDELLSKGGTLDSALARARKMYEEIKGERDVELQDLAKKKKEASSIDAHNSETGDTVWVDTLDEALERQIEAAASKKKLSIKVRPKR